MTRAPIFLAILLTVIPSPSESLSAQDAPGSEPLADGRVIGKIWHTKVHFGKSFEYLNKVRDELEIPSSPLVMLMSPRGLNFGSGSFRRGSDDETIEMKGTLLFLQTKPEVDLDNSISFELIGSEDDFQTFLQEQQAAMGAAAELIGEGDRFELKLDFSQMMANGQNVRENENDQQQGDKASGEKRTIAIAITSDIRVGDSTDEKASGTQKPVLPHGMSTFYRFVDGIMYSGRSSALHHIDLPTRASLKLTDEDESNDIYADFDFTEIPSELKRTFWSAVETQASVWLQRFDDEAAGDYSLRRAVAEGRLELLKSVLFDVDRAWFALNLSQDDVQPITAKLRVQARENSALAGTLNVLSNSRSQLSVLQDDESPLVISSTITLPEFLQPFSTAFVDSFAMKLREAASEVSGTEFLVDDLIKPLQDSALSGRLDAAVCLRGTVEGGLIPSGGIKLENAEQFLSSMEALLLLSSTNRKLTVSHDMIGDYRMVSIHAENAVVPFAGSVVPVQLNLAATGSWLWFTVGGEPAMQSLEELVTNSSGNLERAGQAVPLFVRFRLNKWLGETDHALSKIPQQLLTELERWIGKATTPHQMSISINGNDMKRTEEGSDSFTSYAAKVFRPETSEFELKVRTAGREMVVDASVGTALVKFGIAQFMDSQHRMFKGMDFQFATDGDGKPGSSGSRTIKIGVGGAKAE